MFCLSTLCSILLFLHSIPLYGSTTISLFIHLVTDLSADHWKNDGEKNGHGHVAYNWADVCIPLIHVKDLSLQPRKQDP